MTFHNAHTLFPAAGPANERTLNGCEFASIRNFEMLALPLRFRCVTHLHKVISAATDGADLLKLWVEQAARGVALGSDDVRFHHGTGMNVRNALRDAVPDDMLPPIKQPDGGYARNWDDFYYGVMHALVVELAQPSKPSTLANRGRVS